MIKGKNKNMKQINGFKFSNPNKEHKVKITDNKGNINIYTEKEADEIYRILYAQKYADKVFDDTIKKLGINRNTAHLIDKIIVNGKPLTYFYAGSKQTVTTPHVVFEYILEVNLRNKGIDLSYICANTSKYGITISGNAGGIASTYSFMLFEEPWKKCSMTTFELSNYLQMHKNIQIFKKTNMPYEKIKCNIDELLKTKFGTESKDIGYGSQSSVSQTTIELKRDKFGNLLLDKSLVIWD